MADSSAADSYTSLSQKKTFKVHVSLSLESFLLLLQPILIVNSEGKESWEKNCTVKARSIKMLLHDDVIYQILLWLPVISLLRFKLISRSWCYIIESSYFIRQHLHLHHYNPSLKDKNHNLIYRVPGNYPRIVFPLTSIDSFEAPNICLELDCSDLHGFFDVEVYDIVSFNGIVCLNIYYGKQKQIICLWNPATRQSKFLPQSPFPVTEMKYQHLNTSTIGFGYDLKTNEYRVVNISIYYHPAKESVEVYSLSMDSWRSVSTVFSLNDSFENPGMPFNNGTCFCWNVEYSDWILCFDFGSERFRSISFPNVDQHIFRLHLSVVRDKITCFFSVDLSAWEMEIWMFAEYGCINETWVKLYNIDPYSRIERNMSMVWHSMNGDYLFFKNKARICRYNVVTKEIKNFPTIEKYQAVFKDLPLPCDDMYYRFHEAVLEFKESLVSVWNKNSINTGVKQ